MFKSLSIFAALAVVVGAEFTVIAKREAPPTGFSLVGSSPSGPNPEPSPRSRAEGHFRAPGYRLRGQHPGKFPLWSILVQGGVEAYVAPTNDTVSQVNAWLASNNLTSSPMTSAGDWIAVNMTVSQANQLFAADFSTFQNVDTNQTVHRTLSYSISNTLRASIKAVHPTTTFPAARGLKQSSSVANTNAHATTTKAAPPSSSASVSPDCVSSWTPACFEA